MKEELVDMQEIWVPCAAGEGEAIRFEDGQNLKLVARIANGYPIYLAQDVMLENIQVSQEQLEHIKKTHLT